MSIGAQTGWRTDGLVSGRAYKSRPYHKGEMLHNGEVYKARPYHKGEMIHNGEVVYPGR